VDVRKGEVLLSQSEPTATMFIVTRGAVVRTLLEDGSSLAQGRAHEMDTLGSKKSGATIGALHLLRREPAVATATASTDLTAFTLTSAQLHDLLERSPSLAKEVIQSLCKEVREQGALLQTPLLAQQAPEAQADMPLAMILSTTLGASVESFYRSALNAQLNAALSGAPVAAYFPDMHIQLPLRVAYINGFKILRLAVQRHFHADEWANPTAARLTAACVPGLIMTPISSLLEACNAGHANPAPLHRRWVYGIAPRSLREVIFGVGINQLSEWFEERVPLKESFYRNFIGSMAAGVACGYLSHIPHNLSTLKLLAPQQSYAQHMSKLIDDSATRLPDSFPKLARRPDAAAAAVFFPKGVVIRSVQIAGSFAIINGVINAMGAYMRDKKKERP
jgi:hypothetical protein